LRPLPQNASPTVCMYFLSRTLDTPETNLALDEALLEQAEAASEPLELLRVWESPQVMVVVGRASRVAEEVDLEACGQRQIPVYRRTSGGAAVVAGPGCLMYAVILSYELHPQLHALDQAHDYVMDRVAAAVRRLDVPVDRQGICDLTLGGRKVSGNSVRCRRKTLLYHGTLLYDFPLELIPGCLKMPQRQPEYRQGRPHEEFVANLPGVTAAQLEESLRHSFGAEQTLKRLPEDAIARLAAEKFADPDWNFVR